MTAPSQLDGLDAHLYHMLGIPTADKSLTKSLSISGKAGDVYLVNAWGCGDSLPAETVEGRKFGVQVDFIASDGSKEEHYTNFSADVKECQFLSDIYVAKKDYVSINVSYVYSRTLQRSCCEARVMQGMTSSSARLCNPPEAQYFSRG